MGITGAPYSLLLYLFKHFRSRRDQHLICYLSPYICFLTSHGNVLVEDPREYTAEGYRATVLATCWWLFMHWLWDLSSFQGLQRAAGVFRFQDQIISDLVIAYYLKTNSLSFRASKPANLGNCIPRFTCVNCGLLIHWPYVFLRWALLPWVLSPVLLHDSNRSTLKIANAASSCKIKIRCVAKSHWVQLFSTNFVLWFCLLSQTYPYPNTLTIQASTNTHTNRYKITTSFQEESMGVEECFEATKKRRRILHFKDFCFDKV